MRKYLIELILILLISSLSGLLFNLFSDNNIIWIYEERVWQQGEILSPEQVFNLVKQRDAVFLDIRYEDEFLNGHLPGAIWIPTNASLDRKVEIVDSFDKDQLLVVYCNNEKCHSAKNFAGFLIHYGYKKVLLFEGGLEEWNDAGYPVE